MPLDGGIYEWWGDNEPHNEWSTFEIWDFYTQPTNAHGVICFLVSLRITLSVLDENSSLRIKIKNEVPIGWVEAKFREDSPVFLWTNSNIWKIPLHDFENFLAEMLIKYGWEIENMHDGILHFVFRKKWDEVEIFWWPGESFIFSLTSFLATSQVRWILRN